MLLFLRERPSHGYELIKRLEDEVPDFMMPDQAVVYRMLRKLEREGRLSSQLVPGEGGPARKIYSLTAEGLSSLDEWHEAVRTRIGMLQRFVAEYDRITGGERPK
jgi:DNA-binding PadR family transcriptional regulator